MGTTDKENCGHSSADGQAEANHNAEQWWEEVENPLYRLQFCLECSLRYCKKRQNFFEILNRLSIFLSLFGGSVAVGAMMGKFPVLGTICGVLAAAIFSADSAIDFSRRAEKYANLCKDFNNLLIRSRSESPSLLLVSTLQNERARIQTNVSSTFRALDVLCHNQEVKTRGADNPENIYSLDSWHLFLKDVWKFEGWNPMKLSELPQAKHSV